MYFKSTYLCSFKYQKRAECVKKSELTHSAFLISCAKIANFTDIYSKSVVLCNIMTAYATLLCFLSRFIFSSQIFFRFFCRKSGFALDKHYRCIFIKSFWEIPPIRYP